MLAIGVRSSIVAAKVREYFAPPARMFSWQAGQSVKLIFGNDGLVWRKFKDLMTKRLGGNEVFFGVAFAA